VSKIFEEFQIPQSKPNSAALSSNKSAPANRKKGFYTIRVPKKQEVGGIFVFSGSEL
jgi:hypothetical protein